MAHVAPGDPPRPKSAPLVLALVGGGLHAALLLLGALALLVLDARRSWQAFQEGGWFMFLLLAAAPFTLAAQIAYGALAARRPSWPGWLPVLGAVGLSLLGIAGTWLALTQVEGVLTAASIDPSQRATIMAAGFSEALNISRFATAVACVAASCAAALLAARALSHTKAVAFGRAAGAATALAVLSYLALWALKLLWEPLVWSSHLGGLPALTGVCCAVIGGLAADDPTADDEARGRATAEILAAACALVAAALLAGLFSRTSALSLTFGAIAARSVDPSQKLTILAAGFEEAGATLPASALFALPGVLGAAALLAARPAAAKQALAHGFMAVIAIVLCCALPGVADEVQTRRWTAQIATMWHEPLPAGVTLAQPRRGDTTAAVQGVVLFIGREHLWLYGEQRGAVTDLDRDDGCDRAATALGHVDRWALAPDEATPYRRLSCLVRALRRQPADPSRSLFALQPAGQLSLVLQRPSGPSTAQLPPPFDQLPPPLVMVPASTLAPARDDGPVAPVEHTHVVYLTREAVRLVTLPEPNVDEVRGSLDERLKWLQGQLGAAARAVLTAEPEVPAGDVLAVLELASGAYPMVLGPAAGDVPGRRLEPYEQAWLAAVGDGKKPFGAGAGQPPR